MTETLRRRIASPLFWLAESLQHRSSFRLSAWTYQAAFALHPESLSSRLAVFWAAALSGTGQNEKAIWMLEQARPLSQEPALLASQLSRLRFLVRRSQAPSVAGENSLMLESVREMSQEIEREPFYKPSEFWSSLCDHSVKLLENYGMENFKRTVSHIYQNWRMTRMDDVQVQALLKIWSKQISAVPLLTEMELPDDVGWCDGFNFPFYELADPAKAEVYRLAVGILWEHVRSKDPEGWLDRLEESTVGNPLVITRNGRRISSDLAHSLLERNRLVRVAGLDPDRGHVVGELGAGSGRLAEIIGKTTRWKYCIFDIPPALHVSQWNIRKSFPGGGIFGFRPFRDFSEIQDELAGCRFAFFTSNQLAKFPAGYFETFININSLMEMRKEHIIRFLELFDRSTRDCIYLKQYTKWRNSVDGITVSKSDFALPDRWRSIFDEIDEIHPEFFIQILRKQAHG